MKCSGRPTQNSPTAILTATGCLSSRIAREATTEVGFDVTPLVLCRALKPLFTTLLRQSHSVLPIPSVGLFCVVFSLGSIASPLTGGFDLRFFFSQGSAPSPLSTQHSALSTQHSALTTSP